MDGGRQAASMGSAPRLVLASSSPRRADLLRMLDLRFEADPAHTPEDRAPNEPPEAYVARLAREKAAEVAARHPDALVLAADTVVVFEDQVLEKPRDEDDAVEMLTALSGGWHSVFTGLALASPRGGIEHRVDEARVRFRELDLEDALAYVGTGEPMDKAGAYGIQSKGAAFVSRVEGDFYTVMGLSVHGLMLLLRSAGWRYRSGRLVPVPVAGETVEPAPA